MGVDDNTKTDTRAETTDKPASQDRPYTPPPDNPGSPGQPSRLESRARTREAQQANGSPQGKDTGSPPREERDDKSTSPQAETAGKRPEAPTTPQATGTGNGERRPEARETERPDARNREYRPPPDNPGSPGQPSRLESLARAREEQRAYTSQPSEAGNVRDEPTDEPSAAAKDRDAAEAEQSDDQRDPQDTETPTADDHETKAPADRDHPATWSSEDRTDIDQPQAQDREPPPQQDGPQPQRADRPTGRPPHPKDDRPNPPTENELQPQPEQTTELGDQRRPEQPGSPEGNETDGPQPVLDSDQPGPAETKPTSDISESTAETGTSPGEPTDQAATDNTPTPPQETGQDRNTGESNGDRVSKDKQLEPGDEIDPSGQDSQQNNETGEPGRELTSETNTTEVEEPNPYRKRIVIPSTDPREPLGTEVGTQGRGEFGSPEHDPADRDPNEPDPERPRSPRDLRREMLRAGPGFRKDINETAKPALAQFDSRPPITQPCVARDIPYHIEDSTLPIKAGDSLVGVIGGIIIATELLRLGIGATRRYTRRENDGNR